MVLKQNPNTVTSVVKGRQSDVPIGKNGFNVGFSFIDVDSGVMMNDREIATTTFLRYDVP